MSGTSSDMSSIVSKSPLDPSVTSRLERLVAGDAREAAWLYDHFAGELLRRLRGRYGYLPVDPEDLLQDAFVFYFQNRAKVIRDFLERVPRAGQTMGRLGRHLWDLACGVASNHRRAVKVRAGTEGFEEGDEERLPTEQSSIEEMALDRDQLLRLDRCLVQRGRRLAVYYRLRYWDGYTPNEIADLTGWPKKSTYKLRQALKGAVDLCADKLGLKSPGGP